MTTMLRRAYLSLVTYIVNEHPPVALGWKGPGAFLVRLELTTQLVLRILGINHGGKDCDSFQQSGYRYAA